MNSTPDTINPRNLAEWTQVLSVQDMPIFSKTAKDLYEILDDDVKGVMELAAIILQDPNLTAKVLKMSNSPFYNHSRQNLTTVSRAIIFLGSNVIRELTVACSFFEAVLSPENKEQANRAIADSILAAVQAKEIAVNARLASPESIFVATLLNNIGPIAFWCFSGKHSREMTDLLKTGQLSREEIEKKVLGFKLEALTASLCKSWKLGGLIDEAISNPSSRNQEVHLVKLGREVAHAIGYGWESQEMLRCVRQVEQVTGQSSSIILTRLKNNTETAVKIAKQFGAKDASDFIKQAHTQVSQLDQEEALKSNIADRKQVQFKILQEIGFMMGGRFDINMLFEKALEGIHNGIGMDRTFFCLLSPDKLSLKEKIAFGWQKDQVGTKLDLKLTQNPNNLFYEGLNQVLGLWANPVTHQSLYTLHVTNLIGKVECFLLPVYTENKPIGLFYCDRATSHVPFTEDDFNTAKHFTQQATIALSIYRINKKPHDKSS